MNFAQVRPINTFAEVQFVVNATHFCPSHIPAFKVFWSLLLGLLAMDTKLEYKVIRVSEIVTKASI